MNKVLVVGCGDLGGEVARLLHSTGFEVTGVRASAKTLPEDIACIQADVTKIETLQVLQAVQPNIVIYCVAANAQSDESYYQHYVLGLQNVMATQASNSQLKHVIFISSTRVYGQSGSAFLDESTAAVPDDFGGTRLLEAENFVHSLPVENTVLRLSGIYGPSRFYLVNMAKNPVSWPAQNNWSNRIHRDDAARFIAFLVDKINSHQPVADCYIVTDNLPVLQYEVLLWLAEQMHIDTSQVRVPDTQRGKRLSNARLKSTGFQLNYANYQFGYQALLSDA